MTRLLVALGAFLVTISLVWIVSSRGSNHPTVSSSSPEAQEANIYIQSGTLSKKASPIDSTPTSTTTPTSAISTAPALLTPTATPTPTPSQLIPKSLITPSSTPPSTPTPTPSPTRTVTPTPTLTAMPTSADSGINLAVLRLTSPVLRGQFASVTIQTALEAQCDIHVKLPSGTMSSSQALVQKIASQSDEITWIWKISANTTPSPPDATITFSCTKDGRSASGQTTMEIVASQ